MTQACGIYFSRLKMLLSMDSIDPKQAAEILIDVAMYTGFNKNQRKELCELYRIKSGFNFYTCPECAQIHKSEIDLEAHLFNNKYCKYKP